MNQPISEQIWDGKYRFKEADGTPIDQTVNDTWYRIAKDLARPEGDPNAFVTPFYDALSDYKYLPAGRITAGAGTGRNVTLFNCFVMGTVPDDMAGIFDMLKEAALTMQQGGGIGYDFSTLRPKGAPVKGVAADASGPITFMDVWDAMCRTIMSAGSRRGAMMATMRCDHPDVLNFITAKKDATRLRMFNLSVLITDAFMDAVKNDLPWSFMWDGERYGEPIQARDLWDTILQSTYAQAEPGVIFIDRINEENNLRYCETISATNPCVAYETPILTLEYGYIPIGEIVGQDVHVWNGECWSLTTPRVTGENQPMVSVTLSDGSHLRCTRAHKFVLSDGSKLDASELSNGDKLIKHTWPTIVEGINPEIDPYSQGFFAGDGWVKVETGGHYIGLYGDKKNIRHKWGELSRKEYDINGGFEGTDTTQTKEYLYFGQDFFKPKEFVPSRSDLYYRKAWLAGLIDSDGHVTSDSCIQISSKNREFLMRVKLMLNTMGATGSVSEMKDHHRLSISGNFANELNLPLKRHKVKPVSFPKARFVTVTNVIPSGVEKIVYCFTENMLHRGVFNGVLTGQCGEQPLPPYGACLLGSINLARLIRDPFTAGAYLNHDELRKLVATAVRMMDNVVDVSNFPLPEQRKEAENKRRIGLGVTGLADALVMMRLVYGSDEAVKATETIMKEIAHAAYRASVELAKEKGAFPLFNADKFLEPGTHASTLDDDLQAEIREHGIRNALLTSIAPTGTISLYAGNVSSGIEPIFALQYTRKVLEDDGSKREELVEDYAVQKYREQFGDDDLPPYFVTAQTLTPTDHIRMQAAAQKWVDSSISKTINCPEDISYDDFKNVYMEAWDSGCKGCTTYRPNDITGSVLSVEPSTPVIDTEEPVARPDGIEGATYKIKFGGDPHALYVTINHVTEPDGSKRPFEIFMNTKNPEHYIWTVALTRMMSAVFRMSHDSRFVVEELKAVFDPKGGAWMKGRYVPSVLAAIGGVVEQHMVSIGYIEGSTENETMTGGLCSNCGEHTMKREAGCETCTSCGFSKCG